MIPSTSAVDREPDPALLAALRAARDAGARIRMATETAQHAGHADVIRELIDGKGGTDQDALGESAWREYLAQVQAAAGTFAPNRANDA